MLVRWLRVIVGIHTWVECAKFVVRRWRGVAKVPFRISQGFLDIYIYLGW